MKKHERCIRCLKPIWIKLNASSLTCKCDECKSLRRKHRCKLCGQLQCTNDFCKHHNIQLVKTLSKYFTFDTSVLGDIIKVQAEYKRIHDMLYRLYWDENKTSSEIGLLFHYQSASNLTNKVFKYLEIPSRSVSEASKLNVKKGTILNYNINNLYKCGWHITWDNRYVYLRSSYEKDFANILDYQKILYNVEDLKIDYFDTLKNKYRIAIPDFHINNKIFEIKSKWTLDVLNMKDKFYAYKLLGYKPYLILEHKLVDF